MRDQYPKQPDPIGVLIVTDGRPTLLRAIRSVVSQSHTGPIEIMLLGDSTQEVIKVADNLNLRRNIQLTAFALTSSRGALGDTAWERVARLRNLALRLVETSLVAFLDDDNWWEPSHLSSLAVTMSVADVPAVHSWRRLFLPNGKPWTPDGFPWHEPGSPEERRVFEKYKDLGVFSNDSIVRDAVSLPFDDKEYGMVDMGEWLFRRELLLRFPFETHWTKSEIRKRFGEDDKLLRAFRSGNVCTACSRKATLNYMLGGFSNNFSTNR